MRSVVCLFLTGATIAVAVPAVAQNETAPAAQASTGTPPRTSASGRRPLDPGEVVCERQEVLGSRLARRKVCMTRAEWAERRRLDREEIRRAQSTPCSRDGGSC